MLLTCRSTCVRTCTSGEEHVLVVKNIDDMTFFHFRYTIWWHEWCWRPLSFPSSVVWHKYYEKCHRWILDHENSRSRRTIYKGLKIIVDYVQVTSWHWTLFSSQNGQLRLVFKFLVIWQCWRCCKQNIFGLFNGFCDTIWISTESSDISASFFTMC